MWLRSAIVYVLVALLFVPAARAQDQASLWHSFAERLAPGALVVVRLTNGSTLQGRVVQVTPDTITVLPKTRLPVPVRAVAFAEIQSIEVRKDGMSPGARVLAGVGAAGGVLMIVVVAMLAGMR